MIVAIDFETYYSGSYSLSRMREVEYLLDPRFEVLMCAIKVDHGPSKTHIGFDAVASALNAIDWSQAAMLSHNVRFDGAIACWHFGVIPALYLDTLSMARATTHAVLGKSSLKAVAEYFSLGEKGDEVVAAMGKRLIDFTSGELANYVRYNGNDNTLCRAIFDRFMSRFPKRELRVIDLVARMFILPQCRLDPAKLEAHLDQVQLAHIAIMDRVGHIDPAVFSSQQKFAALLQSHGVEVPTKLSPTTGMETWALAKSDRDFKDLCEDLDQPLEVQAILAARLQTKSTGEETRTAALLELSLREWSNGHDATGGDSWMPVPLRYAGAHTGRLSGDGGYNFQNFKRDSPIKDAITAPHGWRVVHRDSSQIEARMVAWLANCARLLHAFAQGRDVYSEFASEVYGRPVDKAMKKERFVGKTSILGLGYQTGGPKLKHTLYIGNGGISVDVPLEEAQRIVRVYRERSFPQIPALWFDCACVIDWMVDEADVNVIGDRHHSRSAPPGLRGVTVRPDAVWLPNGMCVAYPCMQHQRSWDMAGRESVQAGYLGPYGAFKKLFGGKMTENVSQALARICITDAAERTFAETGHAPFLSTHDSLDYCVPEREAAGFDDYLGRQFAIRPGWAPDLPLASEGGWGRTLQDAEQGVNR